MEYIVHGSKILLLYFSNRGVASIREDTVMRRLFVAGEPVRWSPVHPAGLAVEPVRVCVAAADCDRLLHYHR